MADTGGAINMKDAYYFSHDCNARHDPKISAMRGVYGSEGYGWYWMLIEMLREANEYKLDMQSKYAFSAYALQLHSNSETIQEFVDDCIHEFELFESDEVSFWSSSLLRRMDKKEEVSAKRSAAAKARWNKDKSPSDTPEIKEENANGMQMHSKEDANGMQGKESKVKESKRKESKKNNNTPKIIFADYVSLTQGEYDKLVSSHGEQKAKRMIEILDNYKGANNKKYASDYRAILNWVVTRVEEEEQRSGYKPTQPFSSGQAAAGKYNSNNSKGTGSGKPVSISTDGSQSGRGAQENSDGSRSKYDMFVRR